MSKVKPDKITHLDRKEYQTLMAFASDLERIAKRLKEDASVAFREGNTETTIKPSSSVKVEYKYQTQASKHKFEIELKWDEDEKESFSIS